MTYAMTLVKGETGKREDTLEYLLKLKDQVDPFGNTVKIDRCLISFGWPDFVLLLRGENVELLKGAIIELRDLVLKKFENNLETSTIICMDQDEILKAKDIVKKIGGVSDLLEA